MGAYYEWVKTQWRELRRLINGSPETPLHAANLTQTGEHLASLSNFFLKPAFARIAVTATKDTNLMLRCTAWRP
jgi:hypothetical protein